ncbi:MAG TPA: HupE/UreJ family protein [Lacipirellulaceae bacterium]|jgi:urease accessory protein|nr:HupE/UreJ family protein [Lacipirellulaceae bacterium]
MKTFHGSYLPLALLLLVAGWPSIALAHVGFGSTEGFASGLAHPISGLDHLCAMIGVGIWASQRGGKAVWLFPLAFVIVMALGGLIGAAGIAIPFVERGIVASVLIIGILIAAAVRMPLLLSVLIVGTFAFFHGHAHGSEMPLTASGLAYAAGFLATTMVLLSVGVAAGIHARKSILTWPFRYCGTALILLGLYLVML